MKPLPVLPSPASILHWITRRNRPEHSPVLTADLLRDHFAPNAIDQIVVAERTFPFRVRADLQRAVDRLLQAGVSHFSGVQKEHDYNGLKFSDCLLPHEHNPVCCVPREFEEVDIGEDEPIRCLKTGLWLLDRRENRFAVLLSPATQYQMPVGVRIDVAVLNGASGLRITNDLFRDLEKAVSESASYRGKILSLERSEYSYRGQSAGIRVHRLRTVQRDQVILPRKTVDLLDRNVVQFVQRRSDLRKFQQATKKGILFYGPPGTGKTHTIHYLAAALPGHTTLLITAEQVGLLDEYMTLARLLQPSIVVIEDVDLIARDRSNMDACSEVMLNKLLNEMDGLREEADIMFLLTTNRPEALEPALASRPGRIDQAIEFPLPDEEGRAKLIRLYSQGIELAPDLVDEVSKRTDRVSAAFIKELMRRSTQFHLERNGAGRLEIADVERALEEMLFSGGSLNLKLLGAGGATRRQGVGE